MDLHSVAVIGAGYMGGGIAQTLAIAGHDVVLADASAEVTREAQRRLCDQARTYEVAGFIPPGSAERMAQSLRAASSIEEAVASAEYVTEAVPENLELKRAVLERISRAAPASAIIATNTSAIGLAALADYLPQPFIVAHWFNPAPFVPLVELAGDPDTLDRVEPMLRRAGKVPVRVPDVPGFLGNRLQFALYKEAALIVEEGLATPEQVDLVVTNSFGYRLPFFGPFAVGDISGLDVYAGAYDSLQAHYGERFSAPTSLTEKVASHNLGVKKGGGFLGIEASAADSLAAYRDQVFVSLAELKKQLGHPPGL
jgi:3-hydroxybutyryl-CoA dehydrogenase